MRESCETFYIDIIDDWESIIEGASSYRSIFGGGANSTNPRFVDFFFSFPKPDY